MSASIVSFIDSYEDPALAATDENAAHWLREVCVGRGMAANAGPHGCWRRSPRGFWLRRRQVNVSNSMKVRKAVTFGFLTAMSAAAFGHTWFLANKVAGPWNFDIPSNYSEAAAEFRFEYSIAGMVNKVVGGDKVDAQYTDGTIIEFTVNSGWQFSSITWDPQSIPWIRQGPYRLRSPIGLYQPNGNPITYSLFPVTTDTTPTYTVTVTQFGGGCNGCTSTTTGAGSPTSGGGSGGGGGTDPTPCDDCDTKDHQ